MSINQSIGTGGGTNNFSAPKKTFIQKMTGSLNVPKQGLSSGLGARSIQAEPQTPALQARLTPNGERVFKEQGQYAQPTTLSKLGLQNALSNKDTGMFGSSGPGGYNYASPQAAVPTQTPGTGGGVSNFAKPVTSSPSATNTAKSQFINNQASQNMTASVAPSTRVAGSSTVAAPVAPGASAGNLNSAGYVRGSFGGRTAVGKQLSATEQAKEDYIDAYKRYREQEAIKIQESADLESARKQGETNIKNRVIPIEDITGQLASAQRSSSIASQDLAAKQLVDETRAKNAFDVAKLGYDIQTGADANKNLPVSAQEFEYAKKNGYTGTYQEYQTEDANRKAVIAGLTPAQKQSAISQVAGSFDNEPVVRQYNVIAEGKQFVDSIPDTTVNPADQQGLIYAFAKAMDPNSVVREGEYATVQKYAQSWANTFGFNAARIFSNSPFLTPEAIKNMKGTIDKRFQASKGNYDNVYNEYQRRIEELQDGQVVNPLTNYAKAFGNTGESQSSGGFAEVW